MNSRFAQRIAARGFGEVPTSPRNFALLSVLYIGERPENDCSMNERSRKANQEKEKWIMKTKNSQLKPAGPRSATTSAGFLIGLNTYRAAVLALFFAGAILLSTSAVSAATITVINTNDSGLGSLRQALVGANDGDTINFDSSLNGQRITLTSGELNVDRNVTISGPGAKNLTVDGNWQSRVFHVNPDKTVTIDGLTVANGLAESFTSGGGIYNKAAVLTVTNCTFSGNSATNGGGGIANFRGRDADGHQLQRSAAIRPSTAAAPSATAGRRRSPRAL